MWGCACWLLPYEFFRSRARRRRRHWLNSPSFATRILPIRINIGPSVRGKALLILKGSGGALSPTQYGNRRAIVLFCTCVISDVIWTYNLRLLAGGRNHAGFSAKLMRAAHLLVHVWSRDLCVSGFSIRCAGVVGWCVGALRFAATHTQETPVSPSNP